MTGFNTQVGGGEYRLQFETDNREHYELMQKTARQCVGTGKPLTNGDRIRSMTDEEMVAAIFINVRCDKCPVDGTKCGEGSCTDLIREWLRQPVQPTPDVPDTHEHSGLVEDFT